MGQIEPSAESSITDLQAKPTDPAATGPVLLGTQLDSGVVDLRTLHAEPEVDPNLPAKQAYLARKSKERRQAAVAKLILGLGLAAVVAAAVLIGSWLFDEDPEAPLGRPIVGTFLIGFGLFLALLGVRMLVAVRPVVNRFSGWQWQVKAS